MKAINFLIWCLPCTTYCLCDSRHGPDPWDIQASGSNSALRHEKVPPDLRMPLKKKDLGRTGKSSVVGDWFFLRLLTIMLKGGKVQDEDSSVDIILQMSVPKERWQLLNEYMTNPDGLSEEMYRRILGYIEDAIYKPSVTEKLVMAWTEYIHVYLIEYKPFITTGLALAAASMMLVYLWQRISHRQLYLLVFVILYFYEAFVSYKEAERIEYDAFVSALASCEWRFWSSSCALPAPAPARLLRHVHPLRVALRLAAALVVEPMTLISVAVREMVAGVSDTLWFPLNKIVYCCILVTVNMLLIILLVMILFNFILNIPFNLSFFAGLVNIGVRQRNRAMPTTDHPPAHSHIADQGDRISGANLDKLLSFLDKSVVKNDTVVHRDAICYKPANVGGKLRKSSSAGRLTDLDATIARRKYREDGSGDN